MKLSRLFGAVPLLLILMVLGYTWAAMAGTAPLGRGQATGEDEETPTPGEESTPPPEETPAPPADLMPPADLTPPAAPEETPPPPEETPAPPEEAPAPVPESAPPADLTPPAAPAPSPGQTDVQVEEMSARDIEQYQEELTALRERIMKTRARLMQLREQLLLGSVSIISLSILHTHEVGGAFKLESLNYTLDGFEVYAGVNTPESNLEELENFPIYEGSLLPGEHLLVVDMVFRGRGYGIFSYLNQYLFKVKARYLFTVQEGQAVTLRVISFDEGSFLTSLRNRLKVKFVQE